MQHASKLKSTEPYAGCDILIARYASRGAAAALSLPPLASHAADKGWFGFALNIDAEGAKADTLKAAIQKSVGETLRQKIKHGADPSHDVSLIAASKPAS